MIIFLPVLFLIVGAVSILVIKSIRPQFRFTWMIVMGAAFSSWLVWLILPINPATVYETQNWMPFSTLNFPTLFSNASQSWQIGFLMNSLLLGGILSSVIDPPDSNPDRSWPGVLIVAALGLLATLSQDPFSFVVLLTLLDLASLLLAIRTSAIDIGHSKVSILNFAAHIMGMFLIILICIINLMGRKIPGFEILTAGNALFILIAILLRTLPILKNNYKIDAGSQKAHQTITFFISIAASFSLLAKVDTWPATFETSNLLTWLAIIFGLLNIYRFIRSRDLQVKENSLVFTILAAIAIGIFNANTGSISTWIGLLLGVGSLLFLYQVRDRRSIWLGILICFNFSGLPFSPFAGIWNSFSGNYPPQFILAILMGLTGLGIFGIAFKTHEQPVVRESWVRIIYPAGLLGLALSPFLIWIKISPNGFLKGFWFGGVIVVVVGILGIILFTLLKPVVGKTLTNLHQRSQYKRSSEILQQVGSLHWIIWILNRVAQLFQILTNLLSKILESDGGLLWSFLLFILVLTLVRLGGQ